MVCTYELIRNKYFTKINYILLRILQIVAKKRNNEKVEALLEELSKKETLNAIKEEKIKKLLIQNKMAMKEIKSITKSKTIIENNSKILLSSTSELLEEKG